MARRKPTRRVVAEKEVHRSEPHEPDSDDMDVSFTGLLDEADLFVEDALISTTKNHLDDWQAAIAFDGAWYLSIYPDVKDAGIEPVLHFLAHGWREGRNPNPHFDGQAYVQANPDIAAFPFGPFLHYVCFGFREKRPLR